MFEGSVADLQGQFLGSHLVLQFLQLLVEDEACHVLVHLVEHHDVAESVDELRLESLLHLLHHRLTFRHISRESHVGLCGELCSGV